jgi:hypothetical protein
VDLIVGEIEFYTKEEKVKDSKARGSSCQQSMKTQGIHTIWLGQID